MHKEHVLSGQGWSNFLPIPLIALLSIEKISSFPTSLVSFGAWPFSNYLKRAYC